MAEVYCVINLFGSRECSVRLRIAANGNGHVVPVGDVFMIEASVENFTLGLRNDD